MLAAIFDTPAQNLYPRLASTLQQEGIAGLRVRFRDPVNLSDSTYDVGCGIEFLRDHHHGRVVLIGHSFGGAVVIRSALASPDVAGVVTLSTQSYGADEVACLAPCPLLLIHGEEDEVLPPACSVATYEAARKPKEINIVPGGHVLDESAGQVFETVHQWVLRVLPSGVNGG